MSLCVVDIDVFLLFVRVMIRLWLGMKFLFLRCRKLEISIVVLNL